MGAIVVNFVAKIRAQLAGTPRRRRRRRVGGEKREKDDRDVGCALQRDPEL